VRYTPAMVERVCGCSQEMFLKVANTLLSNSGRDRTSKSLAVGWTQHTVGVQIIRAAGMLQALLGNIGRPAAVSCATGSRVDPRFNRHRHAVPLTARLPDMPDARKAEETLKDFILTEAVPLSTSYWGIIQVRRLLFKAQYGMPRRRKTTTAINTIRRSPATTRTCQ